MDGDPAAPASKYDAFISYSHQADDRLAPALQRALHDFARPRFKKRALHVFRDQTTLSASPELWPAIESALAQSRFLLLMASPASAASKWVGREVAWWLAHRSRQTLLILVTDGDLVWDEERSDFDWIRTTCVARDALGGHLTQEPLWVDLRWARSGEALNLRHTRFRQAVLDIAAPLHGRDKDELDGDDVRRFLRAQRLRRAAVASLATLAVLASGAAYVAYLQRDRALHQTLLVQLSRLSVQADLLRARGEPADASVMLAAEALSRLSALGEPRLEADLALRSALAGQPFPVRDFDFPDRRYRLAPGGRVLVTQDPTVDTLAAYGLPDGQLVSCDARAMRAVPPAPWPASAPAPTASSPSDPRTWVVGLSPDGRQCIVARDGGTIELWSAQPLQRLAAWHEPAGGGGRPVHTVSNDGKVLVRTTRNHAHDLAASTLRLWRRAGGRELLQRQGAEFLAFSPDGRHIATTEGVWRLPDDDSTPATLRWTWVRPPINLAFSPDGAHVAVRMEVAGNVEIWSTDRAEVRYRLDRVPPGDVVALADGAFALAVVGKAQAWLWDVLNDAGRVRLPQQVQAAAIDGRDLTALVLVDAGNGLVRQRVVRLPWIGAAVAAVSLPDDVDPQFVHSVEVAGRTVRLDLGNEPVPKLITWTAGQRGWTDERPVAPAGGASAAFALRREEERVYVTGAGGDRIQLDIPARVMGAGIAADGRTVAVVDIAQVVSLHQTDPAALIAQACERQPQPLPPALRALVPGAATIDVCGRPVARAAVPAASR